MSVWPEQLNLRLFYCTKADNIYVIQIILRKRFTSSGVVVFVCLSVSFRGKKRSAYFSILGIIVVIVVYMRTYKFNDKRTCHPYTVNFKPDFFRLHNS